MKRKAQITIIIIIGIVLLFVFAGVLYIINKTTEDKYDQQKEVIISQVPQEFNHVKKFTDDCLQSVAGKGLTLLGQQGGYIYPDLAGEFKKDAPTESAGIAFEPAKIPYWWYVSSKNPDPKITYSSLQPSLKKPIQKAEDEMTVEKQLARYIKEKLNDECLKGYASFKETGFTVKAGKMETAVFVNPTDVGIYLDYPLEISKGEAKSNPEKFYVSIPLELQKIYSMASLITEAEKNFSFLERQELDFYQVFSGVDVNKLPPTSATTFEFVGTAYWNKPTVKERLQEMLSSYTPMLRVLGSNNFFRYEYSSTIKYPELVQKIYDNNILPLNGAEGLEVRFDYLGWELYYDVNSEGDTIKPNDIFVQYSLLNFGMQNYNTVYDLSWPVLVTVTDPAAFGGKGYSFSFALESNIRNNKPAQPEQVLPPAIGAAAKSMVCDKDKMKAGPLVFKLVDSYTQEPLEKVQLSFSIPQQDTCVIGQTDSSGKLAEKFPAVYGGVANFIKQDYLINYYPLDTYKLKNKTTLIGYAASSGSIIEPIAMHRIKTINATIKKLNLNKCVAGQCYPSGMPFKGEPVYSFNPRFLDNGKHQYYFSSAAQPLKETEQGLVALKKVEDIREGVFSQDFTSAAAVNGGGLQEIRLVPGVYEVTGNLILNEELVIPKEERCSPDVFLWWGSECFTLDETRMEKFPEGMLQWDEKKAYLRITPEDLYSSNLITFYLPSQNLKAVPAQAHKRVVEDLQVMGETSNITKLPAVRAALEPRWS